MKAAEQGLAIAQYNVGMCYYHGIGVTKEAGAALDWLKKAADQGDTEASKAKNNVLATVPGLGLPYTAPAIDAINAIRARMYLQSAGRRPAI